MWQGIHRKSGEGFAVYNATVPRNSSRTSPAADARRSVILVADDEVMIRNLVTLLLQGKGYDVLTASDGREGLDISRQYPGTIDLLITDMQMPRLNGLDLFEALQKERPGIRVIVMSGADAAEIVNRNANMPFLPKPLDGEVLLKRVQQILSAPVRYPHVDVSEVQ